LPQTKLIAHHFGLIHVFQSIPHHLSHHQHVFISFIIPTEVSKGVWPSFSAVADALFFFVSSNFSSKSIPLQL